MLRKRARIALVEVDLRRELHYRVVGFAGRLPVAFLLRAISCFERDLSEDQRGLDIDLEKVCSRFVDARANLQKFIGSGLGTGRAFPIFLLRLGIATPMRASKRKVYDGCRQAANALTRFQPAE